MLKVYMESRILSLSWLCQLYSHWVTLSPGSEMSSDESEFNDEEVELALPDRSNKEYDRKDPFVSKLGGQPSWLAGSVEEEKLNCKVCSSPMYLLFQMDCPLV